MTHLAELMQSYSKVCGCYLVRSLCSSTSTDLIYKTKVVLHYQIYNETFVEIGLKMSRLCPLSSVEWLIIFVDIV